MREWPSRCDLWKDHRVRELTKLQGGTFVDVASAAVGWHIVDKDGKNEYLHNKWRLFTTDYRVYRTFAKYSVDVDAGSREYVQCRGLVEKEGAHYPPLMAREFWKARQSSKSVTF